MSVVALALANSSTVIFLLSSAIMTAGLARSSRTSSTSFEVRRFSGLALWLRHVCLCISLFRHASFSGAAPCLFLCSSHPFLSPTHRFSVSVVVEQIPRDRAIAELDGRPCRRRNRRQSARSL